MNFQRHISRKPSKPTSTEVSCLNTPWYFDLCREKGLDTHRILRNIPHSKEHLSDPANFIDWKSFTALNDNILVHLSDAEMREAGRASLQLKNFRYFKILGLLKLSIEKQYTFAFGPSGFIAKLYPCEMSLSTIKSGKVIVKLKMNRGLYACRAFHLILAGQLMGIPEVLGDQAASVEMQHNKEGAIFTVYFNHSFNLMTPFIQLYNQFQNTHSTIEELNHSHNALLEKYRELHLKNQKLIEAQTRVNETETRYALLSHNVSDVIWTCDLDLNLEYLSPSFLRLTGYEVKEGMEKSLKQFFTSESIAMINAGLKHALTDPISAVMDYTFEAQLVRKDNSTVWTEVKAKFEFCDDDTPSRILGITKDISRRKSIQDRLNRSEKKYSLITNSAQDAIITFNENGLITFANPSSALLFNYSNEDLLGLPIKLIIPNIFNVSPEEVEQLTQSSVQFSGYTKDGKVLILEITFAKHETDGRAYYTGITRDISQRTHDEADRKALHSQLLASQKIESIGQLTGGIAHDFNNLLVAINGYAALGIDKSCSDPDALHYFTEIQRAGNSAAEMTQKLLAFSGKRKLAPEVTNLPALLESLSPMIQRLLPRSIDISFSNKDSNLNVLMDSGQIEQVIINLIVNAGDAMPNGGSLTIASSCEIFDEAPIDAPTLPKGEYVVISVRDTGHGMTKETIKKIFEPFFTTKPEGSGTGLGMAVVHGIVNQHNGFIRVESEIDSGSTFTLFLPSSNVEVEASLTTEEVDHLGGNESLLIVEDNTQVRELACLFLEGLGYEIHSAFDGLNALEYYQNHGNEIDLVIMDVVMPRMSGNEVYQRMKAINSKIKILFTSGYSSSGSHTKFIHEENLDFIQKPYHTEVLKIQIRNSLDKNRSIDLHNLS
ncbi:MAG: PAS domain S-box protein [Pseudomonadales bacterium]|nr:PAS domain S-box protein [Pseudomonadales bacterium]